MSIAASAELIMFKDMNSFDEAWQFYLSNTTQVDSLIISAIRKVDLKISALVFEYVKANIKWYIEGVYNEAKRRS